MTTPARPSFGDNLLAAADHLEVQRWRAAQTVRAHISLPADQDDVLACLGLTDVARPATV